MLEIYKVIPGSRAAGLGLQPGDTVVSINGNLVHDVIDFKFFVGDERISLAVQKKDGTLKTIRIRKDPDDTLGFEFGPFRVKRCGNKCIFCFVDQMPPGCRRTLYLKDDDFRASFLYGNFITLGALSDRDWERIFTQRLSPLYISVHTTDHELRQSMLRNKKAPDILRSLKKLAEAGIRMHTQIVTCPGINDGRHLVKTVSDLSALFPAVSSIAVVPVGVTGFRKKLVPLRTFTKQEARNVLERIEPMGGTFKRRLGTRLVFPSDEFYIKAGKSIPPYSFYEDFPQIENGVGLVASFMREVSRTRLPKRIAPVKATIVTGASFSKLLKTTLAPITKIEGVVLRQITVKNSFFGASVTVAGLLTGGAILNALKGRKLGSLVIIPGSALKEDEDVFLDGMTLAGLEQDFGVRVSKADGYREIVSALKKGAGL